MGLLYTLALLATVLVELERASAEARSGLLESPLASLGVALISTILGIALRVWFVQMRREIEDLEAELHRDLPEVAQKHNDRLFYVGTDRGDFESLERGIEQFHAHLAEFTTSIGLFVAEMNDDRNRTRSLRDQIRSDLSDYQHAQRELMAAIVDIGQPIVRRIGG